MNRRDLNREFWTKLLARIKGESRYFQINKYSTRHWIVSGKTGIPGIAYCLALITDKITVELSLKSRNQQINKERFDELEAYKEQIQSAFGGKLSWERMENKIMSRIAYAEDNSGIYDVDGWDKKIDWLITNLTKLEKALDEPLQQLKM